MKRCIWVERRASKSQTAILPRKKPRHPKYKSHLAVVIHNIGDGRMKFQTGDMNIKTVDKRILYQLPAGERALCRWIDSGCTVQIDPGWTVHRLRMVPKGRRRVRTRIRGRE